MRFVDILTAPKARTEPLGALDPGHPTPRQYHVEAAPLVPDRFVA